MEEDQLLGIYSSLDDIAAVATTSPLSPLQPLGVSNAETSVAPMALNSNTLLQLVNTLVDNRLNAVQHSSQAIASATPTNTNNTPILSAAPTPAFTVPTAIPAKILKQIKNGEFIDFDYLLPTNVGRPSNSSVSLAFDGDGNISLQRNELSSSHNQHLSKKAKVMDLNSWLMAWSRYFQASLVYHPHLIHQLLAYQIYIAQLANDYTFFGWYTYDKAFRTLMANNPSARWDIANVTLYNIHLQGQRQPSQCYLC
eukprot:TCONS_00060295-protein